MDHTAVAAGLTPEEQYIVERTTELAHHASPEPISDDERNAMRAFLQRGETRLSTYQRVAGAFLNGAGLLVLLPGVSRESVYSTFAFALQADSWHGRVVVIPWLFAEILPLYAFYLLLRDLVQFYFSPRFLESDPIRITRFALAGLTLPYDEGHEPKAQVINQKVKDPSFANFILGGTSERTVKAAHDASSGGRATYPLRLAVQSSLRGSDRTAELTNAERIGVALSLAGSLDLSLVAEVARMETSLARHVLLLRKLVLRYAKALILFVATMVASIAIAAILTVDAPKLVAQYRIIAALVMHALWGGAAIWLVRRPLFWIDRLVAPNTSGHEKAPKPFRDPDLQEFEKRVIWGCAIATGISLILAVLVAFNGPSQ
jgi:hypothetical protein